MPGGRTRQPCQTSREGWCPSYAQAGRNSESATDYDHLKCERRLARADPVDDAFDDLDRAGIDPASLSRTPDASMAENADALERGEGNVV